MPRGRVLDLGPVWQSTVNFFVDKGYRVSTEDLLRTWKDFLTSEEESFRALRWEPEAERVSPAALADKFLEKCAAISGAQLPWRAGLGSAGLFRSGSRAAADGACLAAASSRRRDAGACFHSRAPERFHRYRIVDSQTVELIDAPTLAVHAHVFQNREILDLFE